MRLAVIQIGQEADTFNPLPTTMRDFAAFGLYEGQEFLDHQRTTGTVGGYFAAIERSGLDVETIGITRAWGGAGGRITTEAVDYFKDRIRVGLTAAGTIDGLAAHLHGACSAAELDDVEGELLALCREILGTEVPIVLTLDHHANITQRMVDNCDAIIGYRTQPHDPFPTGEASTELLLRIVAGEARPAMAWRKLRLISHQEQYLTSGGSMKLWFDQAREAERDPRVLTASTFPMQPWLDVEEGGWATVVVTDDDPALAERLAEELADLAWTMRASFQEKDSLTPDDAVRAAEAAESGVVVISDTGDSIFGGAAGDSTVLVESMLRLGITGRALVPMVDPVAVATLEAAGEGATVSLPIGGGITRFFDPVEVTGVVRRVTDGHMLIEDLPGREFDMGRTVILDVGPVTVVLSQLGGIGGNHPEVYRNLGLEPADYKMAVLKTASNFQYFAPISSAVIRADTVGPTQSDIVTLPWERIPRPIYPVDPTPTWRG